MPIYRVTVEFPAFDYDVEAASPEDAKAKMAEIIFDDENHAWQAEPVKAELVDIPVDSQGNPLAWPDPSGDGYVDAWNGWYDDRDVVLEEFPSWSATEAERVLPYGAALDECVSVDADDSDEDKSPFVSREDAYDFAATWLPREEQS